MYTIWTLFFVIIFPPLSPVLTELVLRELASVEWFSRYHDPFPPSCPHYQDKARISFKSPGMNAGASLNNALLKPFFPLLRSEAAVNRPFFDTLHKKLC